MKKSTIILITAIFLVLSGCIGTKIYLGGSKEVKDDQPMSRAIDPTTVPAGGTWGSIRTILNNNFSNINGTLDTVETKLVEHSDSITNYASYIQLRLLKSDSALYATQTDLTTGLATKQDVLVSGTSIKTINSASLLGSGDIAITGGSADSSVYATKHFVGTTYAPIANPVFTGVQKVSTTDTLATQAYARSYGGSGTVTVGDVRDEIADSLNVLRPIVYDAIHDSISNLISGGTELSDVAVMLADSLTQWVTVSQLSDSLAAFSGGISEGTVAGMIGDSIQARLDVAVEGLRLQDSLTVWVTPTQLVDSLEAIAGGLVIGDVRDEIADSLSILRADLITITDVQDEIADSLNALRPDILTEADLRKFDSDTIPLFIFGAGSGQTADTAVFNDNAIAGAFYNAGSDTLHITSLRGVLAEGTGTETIGAQVSWHATFKSGSATNLNSSAVTITSITTGDDDTSFDNNDIPPGVWVWCTLSGTSAGNRPSMLILTMTGYKINRSY